MPLIRRTNYDLPPGTFPTQGRHQDFRDERDAETASPGVSFTPEEGTFTLGVMDEAMTPTLMPGDVVVISPRESPRPGDMIVVEPASGDGSAVIRCYWRFGSLIVLTALNRQYRPLPALTSDINYAGKITAIFRPV
jgi:SOS-response transcriptional repressor LexA